MRTGLRLAAILGAVLFGVPAVSQPVIVDENEIVSLANSPALIDAEGSVDQSGRPQLFLRLTFQNDCLSEAGAVIKLAQTEAGTNYIFILQRVPSDGCPDIFSPVETKVSALLPASLGGQLVRLVAKPLDHHDLREITLNPNATSGERSDRIVEASNFSDDDVFPVFEADRITPSQSVQGYQLSGTILLNPDCRTGDVGALVFEVPDSKGQPANDVVLIFVPRNCLASVQPSKITMQINTPQASSGRHAIVLNSKHKRALLIQR